MRGGGEVPTPAGPGDGGEEGEGGEDGEEEESEEGEEEWGEEEESEEEDILHLHHEHMPIGIGGVVSHAYVQAILRPEAAGGHSECNLSA